MDKKFSYMSKYSSGSESDDQEIKPLLSNNSSLNSCKKGYNNNKNSSIRSVLSNDTSSDPPSSKYVEFLDGGVPCPTCGHGRISKDAEKRLVAIIPMTDKRLKPRRTRLYVCITLIVTLLIASLLLFFLFPRDIDIDSNSHILMYQERRTKVISVKMQVPICYNFSNMNFYTVQITRMMVKGELKRKPTEVASGDLDIPVYIPSRSRKEYCLIMKVYITTIDFPFVSDFCLSHDSYMHEILMHFSLTASFKILTQEVQGSLETYQIVDCGNMTVMTTYPRLMTTHSTTTTG